MNVLIIGSGGREHALAWKVAQDPRVAKVFVAPGNAGTATEAKCENVAIDVLALEQLADFAAKNVQLTIVGPEAPLVAGVVDLFRERGLDIFGPTAGAAQLEGSKAFTKDFLARHRIPTAAYRNFTEVEPALAYLHEQGAPIVIKADGLAAGKGVIVARDEAEALQALDEIMGEKVFGQAGAKVIVEEALVGEEASLLAFCDGENVLPLPSAQDHKPALDNDLGPNTGGMGAYSPAPVLPDKDSAAAVELTIRPVLRELKKRGHPFRGILYAGLMLTKDGIKVLEYNTRFGDPECQPLLMRLKGDLAEVMLACADPKGGQLQGKTLDIDPRTALCVVMAAKGYPGDYVKNLPISGLAEADALPGVKVFVAGAKLEDGKLLSSGGRVLGVTALADDLAAAQDQAYAAVAEIGMEPCHYRTDIGDKGLRRLGQK